MCAEKEEGDTVGGVGKAVDKAIIWKPIVSLHKWPFSRFFYFQKYCVQRVFYNRDRCNSISISLQRERELRTPFKTKSFSIEGKKYINSKCLKESKVIVCFIVFMYLDLVHVIFLSATMFLMSYLFFDQWFNVKYLQLICRLIQHEKRPCRGKIKAIE
jgi:hypothetical protein